jgi:hypothetical protein
LRTPTLDPDRQRVSGRRGLEIRQHVQRVPKHHLGAPVVEVHEEVADPW